MATTSSYAVNPIVVGGTPTTGTNSVQKFTVSGGPTSGNLRLMFDGFATVDIAWNAGTAAIETALNNLPSIASGGTSSVGVAVTGGALPGTEVTVTFSGSRMGKRVVNLIQCSSHTLAGGTSPAVTTSETTPGVDVFGRGYANGVIIIDGVSGTLYRNTGTAGQPAWSAF